MAALVAASQQQRRPSSAQRSSIAASGAAKAPSASSEPSEEWCGEVDVDGTWEQFRRRNTAFQLEREELLNTLRQQKEDAELQGCTFEPQLSQRLGGGIQDTNGGDGPPRPRKGSSGSLYERTKMEKERKEQHLEALRQRREMEEMAECSFRPDTIPTERRASTAAEVPWAKPTTLAAPSYAAAAQRRASVKAALSAAASTADQRRASGIKAPGVAASAADQQRASVKAARGVTPSSTDRGPGGAARQLPRPSQQGHGSAVPAGSCGAAGIGPGRPPAVPSPSPAAAATSAARAAAEPVPARKASSAEVLRALERMEDSLMDYGGRIL